MANGVAFSTANTVFHLNEDKCNPIQFEIFNIHMIPGNSLLTLIHTNSLSTAIAAAAAVVVVVANETDGASRQSLNKCDTAII